GRRTGLVAVSDRADGYVRAFLRRRGNGQRQKPRQDGRAKPRFLYCQDPDGQDLTAHFFHRSFPLFLAPGLLPPVALVSFKSVQFFQGDDSQVLVVVVVTVTAEPAVDYYRSSAAFFSFVFFDPVNRVLQEEAAGNPRAAAIGVQP